MREIQTRRGASIYQPVHRWYTSFMKSIRKKQACTPIRLVSAWLLFLILTICTVATPQGERWFDADGTVCMAAEIGHCVTRDDAAEVIQAAPTFHPRQANFVADEGCTDCRHVSFHMLRSRQDVLSQPVIAEETVVLPNFPVRPTTPALERLVGFRANAPPLPLYSLPPRSTASPRGPPIS